MKHLSNHWFFQVPILVLVVAGPALAQRHSVLYSFGIKRTDTNSGTITAFNLAKRLHMSGTDGAGIFSLLIPF